MTKVFASILVAALLFTGAVTTPPEAQPVTEVTEAALLTAEEAEAIALTHAGLTGAETTRLTAEFELDDRVPEYEVEFRAGDWEYDYTIHAGTGEILKADKDYEPKKSAVSPAETTPVVTQPPATEPAAQKLTAEEAKAIAFAHAGVTAGQVTGLRTEYDRDDGVPEYEVEFRVGNYEYEYEIHAETGKILKADKEYDD